MAFESPVRLEGLSGRIVRGLGSESGSDLHGRGRSGLDQKPINAIDPAMKKTHLTDWMLERYG